MNDQLKHFQSFLRYMLPCDMQHRFLCFRLVFEQQCTVGNVHRACGFASKTGIMGKIKSVCRFQVLNDEDGDLMHVGYDFEWEHDRAFSLLAGISLMTSRSRVDADQRVNHD